MGTHRWRPPGRLVARICARLPLWLAGLAVVATYGCFQEPPPPPVEDAPLVTEALQRNLLLDPDDPAWSAAAPDTFLARFETSRGDFTIEVVRDWAPIGADRFYNLVRHGYYDGARFHRVVPGFIVQWGLAADPEVTAAWLPRTIPDDASVVASNVRGAIAYAFTEVDTRSTQVYINLVDNTRLDAQGFPPFGHVVDGMTVVDSLYGGYGEESGGGVRRNEQDSLILGGNAYLERAFPDLDRILRAYVPPR